MSRDRLRLSRPFSVIPSLSAAACLLSAVHGFGQQTGASTPFVSYEAENGVAGDGATVVALTSPPTTEFSSPQLEASGHAYVHLGGTGQYVLWTNNTGQAISALNIRYSIPDSATGGGISNNLDLYVNGSLKGTVPMTSYQTWVYETSTNYNGMSQNPASGNAHVFWDEVALFVPGGSIPSGGTFKLQMDSANTASYYNIDVVDLETPPAALAQPAKTLSILSYGAESNNPSFDNTTALNDAMTAAVSSNMPVWIPPGTFYINAQSALEPQKITIEGAGPWYSKLLYLSAKWTNGIFFHAHSTTFSNLCLDASGPDSTPALYSILAGGGDWIIDNVWSRHAMLVWGSGTNATIENCRVNNSWGDGMNINNTQGQVCTNILIYNNFSRGNGDDAIAVNSQDTNEPPVQFATVMNNTTVASWWANQMGIYGGRNVLVQGNLLKDCVKKQGLELNAGFGALPPLNETAQYNDIENGGSFGYAEYLPGLIVEGGGTNIDVYDNTINNSMFMGVEITGSYNMQFEANLITAPGTTGILIPSGADGSGTISYNMVEKLNSGEVAYTNDATSTFSATVTANNWQGGPSAPASLTPHVLSGTQIKVDWSGVSGATSYDELQSVSNGGPYVLVESGLTGGTYTNYDLSTNTTYYYVVTAANTNGVSAYSGQVSATTQ